MEQLLQCKSKIASPSRAMVGDSGPAGQQLSCKLGNQPSDDTSMDLSMAAILSGNITSLMISNIPFMVHQPDIMRCLDSTGPTCIMMRASSELYRNTERIKVTQKRLKSDSAQTDPKVTKLDSK